MTAARSVQLTSTSLIAQKFVDARRAGAALAEFPGAIPASFDLAYACQNEAIDLWRDELAGWKVGRVAEDRIAEFGANRLIGAIFKRAVLRAQPGRIVEFPVFVGGFGAVEGEFIYELVTDAPPEKMEWTIAEALDLVGAMYIGIETAGSPLSTINELGPGVIATDFGNNHGLIVGAAVAGWRDRTAASLECQMRITGRVVGEGNASSLPGGPPEALSFTLRQAALMHRPMKAGMLISSGAVTGVHDIRLGECASADFGALGMIECRAIAAKPLPAIEPQQGVSL